MVKHKLHIDLKDLVAVKAHLGHAKKYYDSSMGSHILGHRAGIDIINIEKTLVTLRSISKIFEQISIRNSSIAFINTVPMFNSVLHLFAKISKQTVVNGRWISGGFTNFHVVKRHYKHRNRFFLEDKPDFVFLVGLKKNMRVLRETTRVGIPTMALVDSDNNIKDVTYPIGSNDDSYTVLYFFLIYLGYCLRHFQKGLSKKIVLKKKGKKYL